MVPGSACSTLSRATPPVVPHDLRQQIVELELDTMVTPESRTASVPPRNKEMALRNQPFRGTVSNERWVELVLATMDLVEWTMTLCLKGELRRAEPKWLRYAPLHTGARVVHPERCSNQHPTRPEHSSVEEKTRYFWNVRLQHGSTSRIKLAHGKSRTVRAT